MAHACLNGAAEVLREREEEELSAEAAREEDEGGPRICGNCGEQLDKSWPGGYCPECERRETEERAEGIAVGLRVLLGIALLCFPALGQTGYSGSGVSSGSAMSGVAASGDPLTYSARTDTSESLNFMGPSTMSALPAPGPTGSSISCGSLGNIVQPSNGEYLCGINTIATDPDFGAQIVRATDYSLANNSAYPCTAQGMGELFDLGSGGAGRRWASDSSKLLINNSGGAFSLLGFNPSTMQVSPSRICGASVLGGGSFSMSRTSPHVIFEMNDDSESTVLGVVTSGTCVTPETMTQASTGSHATVEAVNPAALMQLGTNPTGTPDGTHTWAGGTSGCVFTPTAAPTAYTPANTLYRGTINDSGAASTWTVTYALLFNFNYVAGLGLPYFPSSSTSCLPASYNPTWNGLSFESDDDTVFSVSLSDNGQSAGWDSAHLGPTYLASYKQGSGCRVWNTHTDQVTGDWGPTGQTVDGQHSYITGTISGTPGIGDTLTQDSTGAQTEYMCSGSVVTVSGSTTEYICSLASPTSVEVGLIYLATADSTHTWHDTNGATITPSAAPVHLPFYYPDVMHDSSQTFNAGYTSVSLVQAVNGKVTGVQGNTPSAGQTTVNFGANVHYSADQQVQFYNLAGAHDSYLNCGDANHCPFFTILTGVPVGAGANSIVIADAVNPNGSYSDTESQSGCGTSCPLMSPHGIGSNQGYSFFSNPNYWNIPTITENTCISSSCQGHSAEGVVGSGRGTFYAWHDYANPALPCTVNGPLTPCPKADETDLLSAPLPEDDHGTYLNHGTADQTPMATILTNVCGQGNGAGSNTCIQTYGAAWESEVIAMENVGANPGATHCNYGSGPAPCNYRFAHTFNSNDNWEFDAQNAIGIISPDGLWLAWPSSWMNTLGCMNGTTNCWGSYVASGPGNASMSGATIQTDGSGVITVTMQNQFCAPGGNQYYWTGSAVTTIACGSVPEQVTLSGFAESWANQTITLTAVSGCDSTDSNAGNCTSFSGTGTGVPASYGPVTESSGTQKGVPITCTNGGVGGACQRTDIWIAKLTSAHQ